MKKTSAIFALLALVLSGPRPARAQTTPVHYRQLGVAKAGTNPGVRVYLGDAPEQVQQVLGPPTRTSSYFYETEEKTATRWHYNNCELDFIDKRLVHYELNDATLAVGPNLDYSFKVGDPIGRRTERVPGPTRDAPTETKQVDYFYGYKFTTTAGKSRNIYYALATTLGLRNDTDTFEGVFQVLFDNQKRIVNIHVTED